MEQKKEGILICIFYLIFSSTSMHESSQKYLPQHHSGSLEGLQAAGCRSRGSSSSSKRRRAAAVLADDSSNGKRDRKDRVEKSREDQGEEKWKKKRTQKRADVNENREFQCSRAMATMGSHGTLRFLKMLRSEIKQLAAVLQL